MKAFADLIRDTVAEWWADNALRLGAALAYYALFSLTPLLIVAIAIVGLVFEHQSAQAKIVEQISGLIGRDPAEAIAGMIQRATTQASSIEAAVVSVGIILIGASGAFAELQQGLNQMWGVESSMGGLRWMIRERCNSFLMVLGVGFLFLLSLLVNAAIAAVDRWFAARAPVFSTILQVAHPLVSFSIGVLLFAMIFKVLPDVRIQWRDVWMGAAVTALLFVIGQWVITFYLARQAVASAFGAAGSIVVILVWVYYSSQILFFGAEFTKVYTRRHGSRAAKVEVDSDGRTAEEIAAHVSG